MVGAQMEVAYRHAIHAVETQRLLDGSSSASLFFRLLRAGGFNWLTPGGV